MTTEHQIRQAHCDQLWQSKGFDSPSEFMEPGLCFACGMGDGGELKRKSFDGDIKPASLHLLCGHCYRAQSQAPDYARWFEQRTAVDTAKDYARARMLQVVGSAKSPQS